MDEAKIAKAIELQKKMFSDEQMRLQPEDRDRDIERELTELEKTMTPEEILTVYFRWGREQL